MKLGEQEDDAQLAVARIVQRWQRRLKLDHWHVNVSLETPGIGDINAGMCDVDFPYLIADIKIFKLPPGAVPWTEEKLDKTIIHELLHLHTAGLGVIEGTPQHVCEEQAIQILSRVIWESYNKK